MTNRTFWLFETARFNNLLKGTSAGSRKVEVGNDLDLPLRAFERESRTECQTLEGLGQLGRNKNGDGDQRPHRHRVPTANAANPDVPNLCLSGDDASLLVRATSDRTLVEAVPLPLIRLVGRQPLGRGHIPKTAMPNKSSGSSTEPFAPPFAV